MATILLVGGEPRFVDPVRHHLLQHGHKVLNAASGSEALEIAAARQPDIILLDATLSASGGIETCRRLRHTGSLASIPILLFTGHHLPESCIEGLAAGADGCLTEPFDADDLERRIQALLGQQDPLEQGKRLFEEIAHMTLAVLSCDLVWLLTLDTRQQKLVTQALAAAKGEEATRYFRERIAARRRELTLPLRPEDSLLAEVALSGVAEFNLPLSDFRARERREVYEACRNLDLFFISLIPLRLAGVPLGVLALGGHEPLDTKSQGGRSALAAVTSQAVLAVENARLVRRLREREAEADRDRAFRQMLLDTMGDGLLVYDTSGQVHFANQRLAQITGYEREALKGLQLEELFPPAERERLRDVLARARHLSTISFEANLLRADGTTLPVLAVQRHNPLPAEGHRREMVMVITDLSRQKEREEMLARQRDRLAALNRATQAIGSTLSLDRVMNLILHEARHALDADHAFILLLAPDRDELIFQAVIGPPVGQVQSRRLPLSGEQLPLTDPAADPDFHRKVEALIGVRTHSALSAPLMVQGEKIGALTVLDRREGTFDRDDADILAVLARSAAIALKNAHLYSLLAKRATQMEQAYNRLQEAERVREEVIQNVSHEFRTPLALIVGYINLLLEGELGSLNEEQERALQMISHRSWQLTNLVESLLTARHLSTGQLELAPTSLAELAMMSVETMREIARRRGIEIVTRFDGGLPEIIADRGLLLEVFDNLLGNAIKFSPNGGTITLTIRELETAVQVSIVDQGIGIPPEEQEKIWDRFYQVDGTTTRQYGGMGLGLSIVKRIIEKHGGRVWVESEPGRGSTFSFILPRNTAPPA